MTIGELDDWLQQHPNHWEAVNDPLGVRKNTSPSESVELPPVYREFLRQIGPISLCEESLILIGREEIAAASSFMRSLNQPEEGIYFDHLIPFCDRTANQWYFCFDGKRIVEFDPLDPYSIENVVAPSFEEFLSRVIINGLQFS